MTEKSSGSDGVCCRLRDVGDHEGDDSLEYELGDLVSNVDLEILVIEVEE